MIVVVAARCSLCVGYCVMCVVLVFAGCGLLYVACCWLAVDWWLLVDVWYSLCVVCCAMLGLAVACCVVSAVCRVLFVVCCLLCDVCCLVFAVRCVMCVACCLLVVDWRLLADVWYSMCGACCDLIELVVACCF